MHSSFVGIMHCVKSTRSNIQTLNLKVIFHVLLELVEKTPVDIGAIHGKLNNFAHRKGRQRFHQILHEVVRCAVAHECRCHISCCHLRIVPQSHVNIKLFLLQVFVQRFIKKDNKMVRFLHHVQDLRSEKWAQTVARDVRAFFFRTSEASRDIAIRKHLSEQLGN